MRKLETNMFITYNGTWRSYKNQETGKYDGPEIRGSVLAYSAQTHPVASKRVPVNLKKNRKVKVNA